MSILHHEIVPGKHILLEQENRVDKRHDHIHLTGGALLVDVLIEVGVLGAASVGEVDLQQAVISVVKIVTKNVLFQQLSRRVEHAGMLLDLDAFDRIPLVGFKFLHGRKRVPPVETELNNIHAVLLRQVKNEPLHKAVVNDLAAAREALASAMCRA